jgi:hypothetical protein
MNTMNTMNIGSGLAAIGKALGKAVVAGIGMELARVATSRVKQAIAQENVEKARNERDEAERELARVRRENQRLQDELEDLRRAG